MGSSAPAPVPTDLPGVPAGSSILDASRRVESSTGTASASCTPPEPVLRVPGAHREPTSCFECGLCCKILQVMLDKKEHDDHRRWFQELHGAAPCVALRGRRKEDVSAHGAARSLETHFFSNPENGDYRMNMQADRCGFLEEGNRCHVHRTQGGAAKSSACRSFPMVSLYPTPRGTFGSLAYYCPDEARSLLETQAPLFRAVPWSDRTPARPSFTGGGFTLSWTSLMEYLEIVCDLFQEARSIREVLLAAASETPMLWRRAIQGRSLRMEPGVESREQRLRHWLRVARAQADYKRAGLQRSVEVFTLEGIGRRIASRIAKACDLLGGDPTGNLDAASPGGSNPSDAALLRAHPEWEAALRRYLIYKLYDLNLVETFGPLTVNVLALVYSSHVLWLERLASQPGRPSWPLPARPAPPARREPGPESPFVKATMIVDYLLFNQPLSILRDRDFIPLLKHPHFAALLLG